MLLLRLVPALNKLNESCESAVDKYSEFFGIDDDLLSMVSDTIDEAEEWKDKADSLYKSAEIYDTNTRSRLDIVVKPFSGTGEQTIYSFLRDFEHSFRGQGNDAKAKPRPATVAVVAQEDTATPPQQAVHAVKGDRPDQVRNTKPQSQQSNTGWYDPSLKFPCPIDGHRHEVAGCVQFFSSTPKQRRDFGSRKICFICMGPMDKCGRKKKIINGLPYVKMPRRLLHWLAKHVMRTVNPVEFPLRLFR